MSLLRRIDALEPFYSPPFFFSSSSESFSSFSSSIFAPQTLIHPPLLHEAEETFFALDHITHCPYTYCPTPLELFDTVTDLILTPPSPPPPRSSRSYNRIYRRFTPHDPCVDLLCDRFDRLVIGGGGTGDRRYKWTTEIEGKYVDRKYTWTAEIKEKEREKEKIHHHLRHYHHHHDFDCYHYYDQGKEERSYKWTAQIKEKGVDGPVKRTYTWQTTIDAEEGKEKEKEKNKNKKKKEECHLVEIVEPNDHRAAILRQVSASDL